MRKICGLMLKDMYELWGTAKALIVIILFYMVGGSFAAGPLANVGILMGAMLPVNLLSYDERSGWARYVMTMPVSRRDIVISKYLIGYLFITLGVLITSLVSLAAGSGLPFSGVLTTGSMALIYLALELPMLFRFGTEKGRIFMILFTALFAVGAVYSSDISLSLGVVPGGPAPVCALALAALLQIPSVMISKRVYGKYR